MHITKSIQTVVQLKHQNLYAADINAAVISELKSRFEGKCYMGCLVLEVLELVERSRFIFSTQQQDGSASCSVRFMIRGLVYVEFEPVHKCVVRKIHKLGHLICKSDKAAIFLQASPILQSIREGQTIVVLAGKSQYTILRDEITINALPFVCRKKPEIAYAITVTDSALIRDLMQTISDYKTAGNPDVYEHFKAMLSLPPQKKKLTPFSAILDKKSIIISRPEWISFDDPKCILHDEKEAPENIVMSEPYELIMGNILQSHIDRLHLLEELCMTYHTMDIVRANKNLWDIYIKTK